jgi:hypothetical protein
MQPIAREIAHAMRVSGKSNWYALATVAIETLTIGDLRDLMPKARPAQFDMELRA